MTALSGPPGRRHEIDALRVLATLLLIVFHTAMVFTAFNSFHIQNLERSETLGHLGGFIHRWHMPLFFLLAGMAAWYALGSRTAGQVASERVRRLFVPLLVGMLLIIPPQVYVERISTWVPTRQSPIDFSGSFFEWYPHTFECCYPDANLSWHHLWFLIYLFVYSLLLLPLFRWLRGSGREHLDRITGFLGRGANLLLPAVWLAGAEGALRGAFPNNQDLVTDLANHANYPFVFLMGFVLVSDPRLDAAVQRLWRGALAAGLLAAIVPIVDVGPIADRMLRGVAEWFILLGLVGLGRATLHRPIRWVVRFSSISLPFYIFHQTVIVVLAYWVTRWDAGIPVKYTVIACSALVITWLLAEAVRLTPVTRAAFGLRARR